MALDSTKVLNWKNKLQPMIRNRVLGSGDHPSCLDPEMISPSRTSQRGHATSPGDIPCFAFAY